MKKDRRTFVLMFVSSFALASIVGYVGIASAQNMTTGSNMTSNATMGNSLNDTTTGTAKELEKLTGNNTQFNNTALANLTTGISEGVSNFTGNNSALSNLSEEMSNITANIVGNQSGNQTGNQS
jgi:septal ring-binding cell division protein DamX